MNPKHFDHISKALVSESNRRRALRALVGGVINVLGVAVAEARKSGACIPDCGECATCLKGPCRKKKGKKRCRRGACLPNPDGNACENNPCKECQNGRCANKANDSACNGAGKCLNGTCNQPPGCTSYGFECVPASSQCCGIVCTSLGASGSACFTRAANGAACNVDPDCASGRCVGFRCQP